LKLIFSQISYRDIQYRIIALKKFHLNIKSIKTSIKLIKFLFIDIKKYSSFDRCNLPVWCQGDQTIGRDNRSKIMSITSILIEHFSCRSSFSINQLYEKIRLLNFFLIR